MSTRRQPGDIVWKSAGAGFTGQAALCVIPLGSEPDECMVGCDDPECKEWPDLWPCDENGKPTGGNCCHVSECQMLDWAATENLYCGAGMCDEPWCTEHRESQE